MASTTNFITNQEKFLSDIINAILPKSKAVDFLVGYFYFSGYSQISQQLKDKPIRILVGLDVDILISKKLREVEDFVETSYGSRTQLKEGWYKKFVKLFNETDFLDTKEKEESFTFFYNKIKDGTLQIRKTEDPCHAKMYLFEYRDDINEGGEEPGTVITGSSNLSYQGLEGRLEINARFTDKGMYNEGKEIFNELWDKSVEIIGSDTIPDFEEKVIKHIWYEKLYSPYLIYIRVLNEYLTIPDKNNILTPFDITDGRFLNLKYQLDAVKVTINNLENHNGAIVSDVVGLGKSIIGSTVARNLKLRTIVIAPPHLCKGWDEYRDEFGFQGTVFSGGKIEAALSHYENIRKDGEQFLIIVDEAHRYRNEETKDYALLHNLCMGNKVMLLTATPFNNEPADIYSLLKLFQIPSRSTLKTVENLGASFRYLMSEYADMRKKMREGKMSPQEVESVKEKVASGIRAIINPLVIRRSRLDLQEIDAYKEDLNQQKIKLVIPNDPQELEYELGSLQSLYLETLEQISPRGTEPSSVNYFKSARYSPVNYVIPEMREALSIELEKQTGVEFNMLMGRQMNIAKFMRRLLVSRFESSVAAFKSSLGYMIQSSEHLVKWFESVGSIPVFKKGNLPDVDTFYTITDDGFEEIEGALDRYRERGFFEIDKKYLNDDFIEDVKKDIVLLKELLDKWFPDGKIKTDPKLDRLILILKEKLAKEPNRKIVIFSEFADTVNYIGEKLEQAHIRVMKYTSTDGSSINKDLIRSNFDAGLKATSQRNDFDVLVATDAISEGYNLHRAGAIINYDIPYNPTRVIQRIGRINRVNKKVFDQLYIFNYFPTDVGEKETHGKEISTLKMAMIHAIMGEDTKALTSDEKVHSYFAEQYKKAMASQESLSWEVKFRQELDALKGTDLYKQALELPHRARTSRCIEKSDYGVLLFGKKGNDYVFKIGNSSDDEPVILSADCALELFKASIQEKAAEALSGNFDTVYQKVKSSLFTDTRKRFNSPELAQAVNKIKHLLTLNLLPQDYLKDLQTAIQTDALPVYEVRFINSLKPKDASTLIQEIPQDYVARLIMTSHKVDEGEETIILSEELQQPTTE